MLVFVPAGAIALTRSGRFRNSTASARVSCTHPALADGVGHGVRDALQRRVRRHVHDVAVPLEEVRDRRLRQEEVGVDVHRHDPVVLRRGHIDRVVGTEDARHVPEHVEPAELGDTRVDDRPARLGIAEIGLQDRQPGPCRRPGWRATGHRRHRRPAPTPPSATRRTATARPMPDPAPVTSATFPSNRLTPVPFLVPTRASAYFSSMRSEGRDDLLATQWRPSRWSASERAGGSGTIVWVTPTDRRWLTASITAWVLRGAGARLCELSIGRRWSSSTAGGVEGQDDLEGPGAIVEAGLSARSRSRHAGSSSAVMSQGNQPSCRAARRIAAGELPPMMIGGCGDVAASARRRCRRRTT